MVNVVVRLKGSPMGGQIKDRGLYSTEHAPSYDSESCLYNDAQHDIQVIRRPSDSTRQDEPRPMLI